jgi:hypothetical protein
MASEVIVTLESGIKIHKNADAEVAHGFLIVKVSPKRLVIYPERNIKRVDVIDNE